MSLQEMQVLCFQDVSWTDCSFIMHVLSNFLSFISAEEDNETIDFFNSVWL